MVMVAVRGSAAAAATAEAREPEEAATAEARQPEEAAKGNTSLSSADPPAK
jgi:hypothetical protein